MTNADKHATYKSDTEYVVQLNQWLLNVIVLWGKSPCCDEEHPCFDDYCWMHEWWAMTTWWTMIMAEWMMKTWCMMFLARIVWKVSVCLDSLVFWRRTVSPPSLWAVWNTPPNARETVEGPPSPSRRGYELLQPGSGSE